MHLAHLMSLLLLAADGEMTVRVESSPEYRKKADTVSPLVIVALQPPVSR
jgi:hypothetical protein